MATCNEIDQQAKGRIGRARKSVHHASGIRVRDWTASTIYWQGQGRHADEKRMRGTRLGKPVAIMFWTAWLYRVPLWIKIVNLISASIPLFTPCCILHCPPTIWGCSWGTMKLVSASWHMHESWVHGHTCRWQDWCTNLRPCLGSASVPVLLLLRLREEQTFWEFCLASGKLH